jgi:hypothetical protein
MRRLLAVLPYLALASPASAAWLEASSDNFVVYSDGNEEKLVDDTRRVEKFDQLLRLMTGTQAPAVPVKLRLYLVVGTRAVGALYPGDRDDLGGFYTSSDRSAIIVADRAWRSSEYALSAQAVLFHEYSHHFVRQYFSHAYPQWYDEGFAEYLSATRFEKDGSIVVGGVPKARVPALNSRNWLPTAQLMSDRFEFNSAGWQLFYAQGWLLTHYLLDSPQRHAQLDRYLVLRSRGAPHADALQKAFGLTDSQLESELRAYFHAERLDYMRINGARFSVPNVSVRRLPEVESALLLPALRVELGAGANKSEGAKLVREIAAQQAAYPGNDYARLVLAEAESKYGSPARAAELLQPLIGEDSTQSRALLDMARLRLQSTQADTAARLEDDLRARALVVRASRLLPNDPETLLLFYQSFAHEPGGPTQDAVDGLIRAHGLLPRNTEIAMLTAREKARAHDPKGAIAVLQPIAYSPHAGADGRKARALIADIEAHD